MAKRVDMSTGDEIAVSGNVRIRLDHKSGRRASICVIPESPDARFTHVKACPAEESTGQNKALSKSEIVK